MLLNTFILFLGIRFQLELGSQQLEPAAAAQEQSASHVHVEPLGRVGTDATGPEPVSNCSFPMFPGDKNRLFVHQMLLKFVVVSTRLAVLDAGNF